MSKKPKWIEFQGKKYQVERWTSPTEKSKMSTGIGKTYREWEEPTFMHKVLNERGASMGVVGNATTLCLPEGSISAKDATDDQIVRAVVGDESVFEADLGRARRISPTGVDHSTDLRRV